MILLRNRRSVCSIYSERREVQEHCTLIVTPFARAEASALMLMRDVPQAPRRRETARDEVCRKGRRAKRRRRKLGKRGKQDLIIVH